MASDSTRPQDAQATEASASGTVAERNAASMTQDDGKVPIERFVDLDAIFGRELLDEVRAVTAELAAVEDRIKPLMERAAGVANAVNAATDRLHYEGKGATYGDSHWQFLNVLAGMPAFMEVATRLGLFDAIFEAGEPGTNPVPGRMTPRTFALPPLTSAS